MSQGHAVGPESQPDKYTVGMPVSTGGEATLFRGSISSGGVEHNVAIKVLRSDSASDFDDLAQRWDEQVELLRSLAYPSIVTVREGFVGAPIHRAGEEPPPGRSLYLIMNWVEGETLEEYVRRRPDRDLLATLDLLTPVAAALEYMHGGTTTGGIPVVHRDVKPANIIVQPDGGAVLVDFGLARTSNQPSAGAGAGTDGYRAPETHRGEYGPSSDGFALAGCVSFALTGQHPAEGADPAAVLAGVDLGLGPDDLARVAGLLRDMRKPDPAERPDGLRRWSSELRNSTLSSITESAAHGGGPGQPGAAFDAEIAGADEEKRPRRAIIAISAIVLLGVLGAAIWRLADGDGGEGDQVFAGATSQPGEGERSALATTTTTSATSNSGEASTSPTTGSPVTEPASPLSQSSRTTLQGTGAVGGAPTATTTPATTSVPQATTPTTTSTPANTTPPTTTTSTPPTTTTTTPPTTTTEGFVHPPQSVCSASAWASAAAVYIAQEGLDAQWRDSDGDCIHDSYEINSMGTSASNRDTDGDGVQDGIDCDSNTGCKIPSLYVQSGFF